MLKLEYISVLGLNRQVTIKVYLQTFNLLYYIF